jgi:4-hydroxy-2-oxoheptanedioate aldolase
LFIHVIGVATSEEAHISGNPLKDRLATGRPAFGGWCTTGAPFSAEIIALHGYDWIGLDAQHGLYGYENLLWSMMALARTGRGIVVRMPSRDSAAAGRMLDAGAHGVIFPMIETAGHAREAVEACRIHPGGKRSFGPMRASQSFGRDPVAVSEGALCIVMVETALAVENIDEILDVPGIDCIYIGPADLAITMGLPPGMDPIPGPHAEGIDRVLKAGQARGVPVGMPCASAVQAIALAERGFGLMAVGSDTWWLNDCAAREAATLRQAGHLSLD